LSSHEAVFVRRPVIRLPIFQNVSRQPDGERWASQEGPGVGSCAPGQKKAIWCRGGIVQARGPRLDRPAAGLELDQFDGHDFRAAPLGQRPEAEHRQIDARTDAPDPSPGRAAWAAGRFDRSRCKSFTRALGFTSLMASQRPKRPTLQNQPSELKPQF
jgi:hypothetical protein